jgi:hypothetical protein
MTDEITKRDVEILMLLVYAASKSPVLPQYVVSETTCDSGQFQELSKQMTNAGEIDQLYRKMARLAGCSNDGIIN